MKIPYNDFELTLALLEINEEHISHKKIEQFFQELSEFFPKEKSKLNKEIADHNGITVIELINSPNYEILCDEYRQIMIKIVIKKLKDKFELSDKQAWAVAMSVAGLL